MTSTTRSMAQLRGHAAALMLLLPAAFTVAALPTTAAAQSAAVEVRSLEVRSDGDLGPGARLNLRAVATPRGQATVRIQGIRERIALREVTPGIYVGRYTVKRGEVVRDDREVRVMLRLGNRTAAADYTLAEVMAARPPVASLPPPPPPRIERFGVVPVERLEPGAELRFALEGPPGATVVLDLPGVSSDVAMREIRPGRYEGAYTLRRSDNLAPQRPIVATLRIGDRVATANLGTPLVVQPQAGNRPPPPAVMPLQIVSHSNNGVVQTGTTVVQGRTAPFANVQAKVEGSTQVPGGFSVAQQLFSQTLQADANGNFSFSFTPRIPLPGSRYEISLVSTKGNSTNDTHLTLFQR
ncbi:MAG: hypothetical protein V4864_04035 [Pseudomonadota bacterium]